MKNTDSHFILWLLIKLCLYFAAHLDGNITIEMNGYFGVHRPQTRMHCSFSTGAVKRRKPPVCRRRGRHEFKHKHSSKLTLLTAEALPTVIPSGLKRSIISFSGSLLWTCSPPRSMSASPRTALYISVDLRGHVWMLQEKRSWTRHTEPSPL